MEGAAAGFGVAIEGLPGVWPVAAGPTFSTVAWEVVDEPFDPSGDWWWRESTDGLTIRFLDEGEYRLSLSGVPRVTTVLGPADARGAALSFVLAVLPLSLPLFGLEPFHGSVLATADGRALLVMGFPEAGKSTTAAALRAAGLRFLADDAGAIDGDGRLWPGPPLLSARSVRDGDRPFATYDGKTVVAIADHDLSPREVGAGVILAPRSGVPLGVQRLRGKEAMVALLEQVRSPWVMPERRQEAQFHAAALLGRSSIGVVSYDKARHGPDEVAAEIMGWLDAGSV